MAILAAPEQKGQIVKRAPTKEITLSADIRLISKGMNRNTTRHGQIILPINNKLSAKLVIIDDVLHLQQVRDGLNSIIQIASPAKPELYRQAVEPVD